MSYIKRERGKQREGERGTERERERQVYYYGLGGEADLAQLTLRPGASDLKLVRKIDESVSYIERE